MLWESDVIRKEMLREKWSYQKADVMRKGLYKKRDVMTTELLWEKRYDKNDVMKNVTALNGCIKCYKWFDCTNGIVFSSTVKQCIKISIILAVGMCYPISLVLLFVSIADAGIRNQIISAGLKPLHGAPLSPLRITAIH